MGSGTCRIPMFLIAEIGASHNRKLRNVIRMIRETEADAIKLQTWSKDSMAVSHRLESGLWAGKDLVDLYRKAHLPWEWQNLTFGFCDMHSLMISQFKANPGPHRVSLL